MQRTDRSQLHDPRVSVIVASRWTARRPEEQSAAAEAALSARPVAPGLIRLSVFREVEGLTLFFLAQWTAEPASAADLSASGKASAALATATPGMRPDWQISARPYRRFVGEACNQMGCLVVVRQPLVRPDPQIQRDWVDTVLTALESEAAPPAGLCAATFFLSEDGSQVLNLAEWTSAEAHRAALRPSDVGQYGSLGESPQWLATRSQPGIRPEHEVRRYQLVGAIEPGENHRQQVSEDQEA